jgi:hypothetical protein
MDRERAIALKAQARAKVKELAAAVKRAKLAKREQVKSARAQCKAHRCMLVRRAIARRKRLLEELRETTRQEREAAKGRCVAGKARAKESALSIVQQASHALQHERVYQADLKRIESNNRAKKRGILRASKTERRSESDGEVLGNIPPELAPLWEKVKRRIKDGPRRSRTEAFLQYAQENPHEAIEAQEGGIDDTIRELERRQNEATRIVRMPLRRVPRHSPELSAAVPF